MTKQEIQELRDIQGFIDWSIEHDRDQGWCLANIGHDVGLLMTHPSDGSTPRTAGYAKFTDSAKGIKGGDTSISTVSTGEGQMP